MVDYDECFDPIRWSCETRVVFVSRGGERGVADALKTARRSSHSCCKTDRQRQGERSPHSDGSSPLIRFDEA